MVFRAFFLPSLTSSVLGNAPGCKALLCDLGDAKLPYIARQSWATKSKKYCCVLHYKMINMIHTALLTAARS